MKDKIKLARQLRQEQTKAEKKLWSYLRNRQFENLKFRRQHPLKEYIVDFFCEEYGIIIELDGEYHKYIGQLEKDKLRDLHLTNLGYKVLRFENKIVFDQTDVLFQSINLAKEKQNGYALERKSNLEKRKKNRPNHLTPSLSSRRGSHSVLSTKKLTLQQNGILLDEGINVVEYDAIKIDFLDFSIPKEDYDFLIFTSKNAIKSLLKNRSGSAFTNKNQEVLCVGEKTELFLKHNGFKVLAFANNAADLAKIILSNYREKSFLFLSGSRRRHELPDILKNNNVRNNEIMVYKTTLNPKQFDQKFDGVLFFSPSGVQSYMEKNRLQGIRAFCIGGTTAKEAKKHTEQVIVSKRPTIENLLETVIASIGSPTFEKTS